jgi:CHAT domain-containing protein
LALAGANRDAEEGWLTAWDASGLDLGGTELVVLPAGLPVDEAGSHVAAVGLSRSFVLAEARAVITSLWPAADSPRQELLVDFYRQVQLGQSCNAAWRDAKQRLRTTHPDPALWGAFVYLGPLEASSSAAAWDRDAHALR